MIKMIFLITNYNCQHEFIYNKYENCIVTDIIRYENIEEELKILFEKCKVPNIDKLKFKNKIISGKNVNNINDYFTKKIYETIENDIPKFMEDIKKLSYKKIKFE